MGPRDTLSLVRTAYSRYQNLLLNFRACVSRDNMCVTWRGYEKTWVGAFPSYNSFVDLAELGQYSFQTTDGALFQVFYEFDRREVVNASLAFIRAYGREAEVPDIGLQEDAASRERLSDGDSGDSLYQGESPEEDAAGVEADQTGLDGDSGEAHVVSWIRIDLARAHARGLAHPACHMHIDGFPDLRLPVRGVPTPLQFVDLVVSLVYPRVFHAAHFDAAGALKDESAFRDANRNPFSCSDAAMLEKAIHLWLPGLTQVNP